MARERKTVRVAEVVELANSMLRNSRPGMISERNGIFTLTESILVAAGAYHGYGEFAIKGTDWHVYGLRRQFYHPCDHRYQCRSSLNGNHVSEPSWIDFMATADAHEEMAREAGE